MKKFALIGNPNCGKTTLFNNLTGSTAHVGNWPGVTVDKKEGVYKKLVEDVEIIDLPGIYSLSPYTPEEVISRNYILNEKPDCIINIVDATNLERNLYLTTQIMEIDVPIVIALNMADLVTKNGDKLDLKELQKNIGVDVVFISALKNENIEELMEKAFNASLKKRSGKSVLEGGALKHLITDVKIAFEALKVENPLFHAIKLIENDELEVKDHPNLVEIVENFKNTFNDDVFGNDLEAVVADSRYKYITNNYSQSYSKAENKEGMSKSDKIDRVLTNKWLGIPIFLIILFLIFHMTFSENFLFLGGLFKNVSPSFEGTMFEGLFWTDAGINSPGVILFNFLDCITSSLSDLIASGLEAANASSWVQGLVVDGIFAGVFAVLSFVPQILLLFLFFSILEDTGYMARVAFILDRIFRKFGLSGRAFMPMIMGFGCSVPAMINTRTLADENERTATVRVIPFFSCGAKLPILTAIAGGIAQVFNFKHVDLITYSMYIVGIATAIICVILMRKTVMRGSVAPFIMELPTYHKPQPKSLMVHLWDKLKHYIKKAFTIILVSTVVIWVLQSFTFDWNYIEPANISDVTEEVFSGMLEDEAFSLEVLELNEEYVVYLESEDVITFNDIYLEYLELEDEEEIAKYENVINQTLSNSLVEYKNIVSQGDYKDTSDSILAGLGKLVTPIFTPLGFGSNLNHDTGWVFPVSAVTGLIAKENVIATFSVLAQSIQSSNIFDVTLDEYKELYEVVIDEEGVGASVQMINSTNANKNFAILISFIVFNMTTIPCFAAVATAKGELSKKKFRGTILFWLGASYITSMIIYLVLSHWWTSFIFVALGVLTGFMIRFINKYKDQKKLNETN